MGTSGLAAIALPRLPRLGDPSEPSLAAQTVELLAPGSSEPCPRPSRGPPRRLPWGYGGTGGRGGCSPHSAENREEPAISSQVPQLQWFAQSTSGIRRACAVHAR